MVLGQHSRKTGTVWMLAVQRHCMHYLAVLGCKGSAKRYSKRRRRYPRLWLWLCLWSNHSLYRRQYCQPNRYQWAHIVKMQFREKKIALTMWWANTALGMPVTSRFTGRLDADADGALHSMEIFKTPSMIIDVTFVSEMEGNCIFSSGFWTTDHGEISMRDSNNGTGGKADWYKWSLRWYIN